MGARRRTWPDFSPCNSTTLLDQEPDLHIDSNTSQQQQQLGNSSCTQTNSYELIIEGRRDSTGSCPAWSLNSFAAIIPASPSPKCSSFSPSCSIISCSPPPSDDIFYSQISTEYSTPRNKSICTMTTDEIDEEMNNVNNLCNSLCQPNSQTIDSKGGGGGGGGGSGGGDEEAVVLRQEESQNQSQSQSGRYLSTSTSMETCLPLVGMPLLAVREEEAVQQQEVQEINHNDYSNGGGGSSEESPFDGRHRLMARPKPYHAFLDDIKKKELEDQIAAWKEAKHHKLMNKLRRKENAINAWELRQTQKATLEMKKIENKLEKKRARALKKMQKKISNARKKADEMRNKERRSTVSKISMTSKIADKISATGNTIWLKLCFC